MQDFVLMELASAPTIGGVPITPIPLLVDAATAAALPGAPYVVPFTGAPSFDVWASASPPKLLQTGYGDGSHDWPTGRGRDEGVETWASASSSAVGIDCVGGESARSNGLLLTTYASDASLETYRNPDGTLPYPLLRDGDADPAGAKQSWVGAGDSGGPLLMGSFAVQAGRPALTALPAGNVRAVIGISSRFTYPVNDAPSSGFAATFTPDAGVWFQKVLADRNGNGKPDFVEGDDPDGDGYATSIDNCPETANATQSDLDGDGLGDACDLFPCALDADHDGAPEACTTAVVQQHPNECGAFCSALRPDNCTGVPNPTQRNCNALSETAQSAAILGDACDPVPCPAFEADYGGGTPADRVVSSTRTFFTANGMTYYGTKTVTAQALAGLDVLPVGSHGAAGTARVGQEVAIPVSATNERYCYARSRVPDCLALSNVGDGFLGSSRASELPSTTWNRITIAGSSEGQTGALTYVTGNGASYAWSQSTDFSDWISRFGSSWPIASAPVNIGDGVGGLWTHGVTTVGMSTSNSYGTGFHPKAATPTQAATQLANAYQDVTAIGGQTLSTFSNVFAFYRTPFRPFDRDCLACGSTLPDPLWYTTTPVVVLPDPTLVTYTGGLQPGGALRDTQGWYSSGVVSLLQSGNVLVEQVEVQNGTGAVKADVPAAVFLSSDGTVANQGAFARNRQLVVASELTAGQAHAAASDASSSTTRPASSAFAGSGPPGSPVTFTTAGVDGEPSGPAGLAASSGATPATSGTVPPRSNFLAVYARDTATLFVAGGVTPGTTTPERSVTIMHGGTTVVLRLTPSFPGLYKVLAATYLESIDKLVLLDEGTDGLARLLLVDTKGGPTRTVETWTRQRQYDQLWLGIDRDGSLLIEGSSAVNRSAAVFRVDPRSLSAPTIFGVRSETTVGHPLVFQPVVGETDYLFVESNGAGVAPSLLRSRTLPPVGNPTWATVGSIL